MFASVMSWARGAIGLSWLQVLPWAALAWGASLAGAGAWAHHAGVKSTTATYEAQKSASAADAANALALSITHAADTSLQIVSVAGDYLQRIAESRVETRTIIKQVQADVQANVNPVCIVPAATRRLRQQQVDTSRAIATDNYPVQR